EAVCSLGHHWDKRLIDLVLCIQEKLLPQVANPAPHYLAIAEIYLDLALKGDQEKRQSCSNACQFFLTSFLSVLEHQSFESQFFIRLSWLRARYEAAMGNMDQSISHFEACEALLKHFNEEQKVLE